MLYHLHNNNNNNNNNNIRTHDITHMWFHTPYTHHGSHALPHPKDRAIYRLSAVLPGLGTVPGPEHTPRRAFGRRGLASAPPLWPCVLGLTAVTARMTWGGVASPRPTNRLLRQRENVYVAM